MPHMSVRVLRAAAAAVLLAAGMTAAQAQPRDQAKSPEPANRLESLQQDRSCFSGQRFGGSERSSRDEAPTRRDEAPVRQAQMSPSELVVRLDRMENQIRQLTGLVEQLQFRNQQLEQQLRRLQEPGGGPALPPAARPPPVQPSLPPAAPPPPPPPP